MRPVAPRARRKRGGPGTLWVLIGKGVRPGPLPVKMPASLPVSLPVSLINLDRIHFQPYIPTSRRERRLVKSGGN